jgi:transposase-like protein
MDEDYPRTLSELEDRFSTNAACLEYLQKIRWPNGFICPQCKAQEIWKTGRDLFHCVNCGAQSSVNSGTILHGIRKPLPMWFRAMWHITNQKYGANALGMKRLLGLGSYNTAWQWLHKLRRAMVRPDRDKLCGMIEVDETYVGGEKPGKRGRGAAGKALVGVAVEMNSNEDDHALGRIRLQHLENASAESLIPFIQNVIQPDSTIRTDDWAGYTNLNAYGFTHVSLGSKELKSVHLVAALLKRWLLGTYQGAVRPSHLTYYLDEFTFRFNRRKSASRGKLFYRLVQQAMMIDPAPAPSLKGPALPFLAGQDNSNLDPLDADHDHNI